MALCVVAATMGGDIGLYALMATSFFMSIQFPTIFTMSLRGLGVYTKSGSSFLVMAIVGGALIPLPWACISEPAPINFAMLVPAACFAVVLWFAVKSRQAGGETRLMNVALAQPRARAHRARTVHARVRRRRHRQSVSRARR